MVCLDASLSLSLSGVVVILLHDPSTLVSNGTARSHFGPTALTRVPLESEGAQRAREQSRAEVILEPSRISWVFILVRASASHTGRFSVWALGRGEAPSSGLTLRAVAGVRL